MIKYSKTKDPASQNSITVMISLLAERPMAVHPTLIDQVDEKEQALLNFKEQLSKFKPKQSVLEVAITKSMNPERIETFQDTLQIQKNRAEEKKAREANEKEAKAYVEKITEFEERKRIEMEERRRKNEKVLAEAQGQTQKKKISKRAQKKLDKQLADKNISQIEKQIIID